MALRHAPRRVLYALAGAVAALGAPVGLFVFRALTAGERIGLGWVASEWASASDVYVYLLLSTPFALGSFGFLLGRSGDALAADGATDALTGLWNRRYFEARLAEEVARASRSRQPIAIVMLDLDRLKQINDTGGHAAGDAAISNVAAAIRGSIRRSDIAARLSGDELAVLATGTRAGAAVELARRIQETLQRIAPELTVSIGVTDLDAIEERTGAALLRAGDLALYEAKRAGRNRVSIGSSWAPAKHPSGVRRIDLRLVPGGAGGDAGGGRDGGKGGGENAA